MALFLCSARQRLPDPVRTSAHRQYGDDVNIRLIHRIIYRIREALCGHTIKAVHAWMDAAIEEKRLDIGHDAVPEIISDSRLNEIIETFPINKISTDFP